MRNRLWVYHVSNGALAFLLGLAVLGRSGGVVWISALAASVGYPITWIVLGWRARRRAGGYTPGERAYARGSIALMVLAWMASLGVAALTTLLYLAFRPHSKSVERHERPGVGIVVNRTQIEPEFGDGGIRRNYYSFESAAGGSEEIGRYEGDVGMFANADNLALVGEGERLELVVGGFHARRSLVNSRPTWKTWVVGSGNSDELLRRHLPPMETVETTLASGEVSSFPMPRLHRVVIESFDPDANRLEAAGWLDARPDVELVYRRADADSGWELDVEELLARNESETRPAFPAGLRAEYASVVAEPKVDLFHPGAQYDSPDPDDLPRGARLVGRGDIELEDVGATQIPFVSTLHDGRPYDRTHTLEGAWTGADGRLYYYFTDFGALSHMRSATEGRWALVYHVQDERASHMLLLRLVR